MSHYMSKTNMIFLYLLCVETKERSSLLQRWHFYLTTSQGDKPRLQANTNTISICVCMHDTDFLLPFYWYPARVIILCREKVVLRRTNNKKLKMFISLRKKALSSLLRAWRFSSGFSNQVSNYRFFRGMDNPYACVTKLVTGLCSSFVTTARTPSWCLVRY